MGIVESMLPDTITLTDDQFKTFLEKTVLAESAKKMLAEIASNPIHPKTTEAAQGGGVAQEQDEGNTARVTD